MDTKEFRTRQEIIRTTTHPKAKKYIIGLDAGYSSMKVYHENGYFCFPSYARKIDGDMLSVTSEKDILYRDLDTNELYMLGQSAQDMISSDETNDTDGELYSRKRYGNKAFKILCNASIAIAILDKQDNREVVIQTGLPSSYETADRPAIIKALSKQGNFEIKLGNRPWRKFSLAVKPENIFVMPQPAGSLYSVLIKDDGKYIANAKDYLFGNVLVMDIGFGTFDFYGIKSRTITCKESIDEIGMRQVFKTTSKKIMEEMNEEIRIQALQKNLTAGKVTCLNEEEMKTEDRPLEPLLSAASDEVFKDAIERAKSITSAFRDYNYLIVSGGTGDAWYEKIEKYLSGMHTLHVMKGNVNDHLPMIYSNVRGYYMFQYTLNKR